jgi:hypothetical protein
MSAPKPPKRAVVQRMSDVQPRPLRWLWPGRLPFGKITILDGDPGLGKSLLTIWLAASITRGRALPGAEPQPPASVVMLNAEDDAGDTIRPRLEAAGADLSRVVQLTAVDEGDEEGERPVMLPADFDAFEQTIVACEAALAVVDPFVAYLGGEVDATHDQDVRRCLARLKDIGQRTGCALLLVRHLNKVAGASAIYRGGGSIGIIGAARSGLLVAKHPEHEAQRVLAVTKSNLTRLAPALAYEVVDSVSFGQAVIRWQGEAIYSADELLSPLARDEAPAVAAAAEFLRAELAAGRRPTHELLKAARAQNISQRALERAKGRLNIGVRKVGFGEDSRWYWSLAESPENRTHAPKAANDEPKALGGFDGGLRSMCSDSEGVDETIPWPDDEEG